MRHYVIYALTHTMSPLALQVDEISSDSICVCHRNIDTAQSNLVYQLHLIPAKHLCQNTIHITYPFQLLFANLIPIFSYTLKFKTTETICIVWVIDTNCETNTTINNSPITYILKKENPEIVDITKWNSTVYTVSQKTSKIIFVVTTSNFHQIWQFLAQWWQIV